jgi:hypothetical protein
MHSLILSTAIAALSTRALAGIIETRADPSVLQFVDGDWEDKNQGDVYPIKWSKGNGMDVAVSIKGEGGYSEILCGRWKQIVPVFPNADHPLQRPKRRRASLTGPSMSPTVVSNTPSG